MSEPKDPAIQNHLVLFGKTIPLPACGGPRHDPPAREERGCVNHHAATSIGSAQGRNKRYSGTETALDEQEDCISQQNIKDVKEARKLFEGGGDKEASPLGSNKTGDEQSDTTVSDEQTVKKPDKIVPCPRCSSMDTKFCYYNNYNVNQPRHFCRNCQRYWTAGGSMRNVPVGAGRRRNKNSSAASHYRHAMASTVSNPANRLQDGGTFLAFGSGDNHPCARMPKISGMVDPREAANSSIWTTLGLRDTSSGSPNGVGFFKAFHSMDDGRMHIVETSPVLQANRAALSRSLNFHEST